MEHQIDPATRRKLRQKLGSRTQRRYGTNKPGRVKPRQALAKLIEEWKVAQSAAILVGWCAFIALMLLSTPAYAACPSNPQTLRGTNANDTLTGAKQRTTYFYGMGGTDAFNVENPSLFSFTGCTSRDYWDEIRDYKRKELINVPGTVKSYRISGCLMQWQNTVQTHNGWYFVKLNLCSLPKSDVIVR